MFYRLTDEEAAMVRALAQHGTCEAAAEALDVPAEQLRTELLALRERLLQEREARAA